MHLKFIVCGLEHSGTTLVSDIFRQSQDVDSGFEGGIFLCDSPRSFPEKQPFYKNMIGGWGISEDVLAQSCQTDDFVEFYTSIYKKSDFFDPQVKFLFDKTPRYFQHIYDCYEKAKVPIIATYKDPRSIVFSDFKRTGNGEEFEIWYEKYKTPKLRYLLSIYNNSFLKWKNSNAQESSQILCVSLESICLNSRETLEKMFFHIGLEFKLNYILMKNLRYSHTRAPQISSRIPFEYLESLNVEQLSVIEHDFSALSEWFYS